MPLSDAAIRNAKPGERNYKLADAGGLYLFVTTKGARSWRMNYRFAGSQRTVTFGRYPEVKLAEARDRRDDARAIIRAGKDPIAEIERRRLANDAAASATFRSAAEAWLADARPGWSPSYLLRVENRIKLDLFPALGKRPIGEIDRAAVLAVLRKIEHRGSIETAKRVHARLSDAFHQSIWPGETGFANVTGLEKTVYWGVASPPATGGVTYSGGAAGRFDGVLGRTQALL